MRQPDYIPLRIPFNQGINEVWERGTLPTGSFSRIYNMRWRGDGLEQRKGQALHHTTTAYSSKAISSGYGFSKGRITERALFAQYDDGSIDKATDNPPTVTTGNFGSSVLAARHSDWAATTAYVVGNIVFSTTSKTLKFICTVAGTSGGTEPTWPANLGGTVSDGSVTWEAIKGVYPGAWAKFRDYLLYADGAGQAQIYTGTKQNPVFVNVYKGTVAIPDVPEEGADYTQEATDGLSSTVVVLDSLDTLANYGAIFIGFDAPVNKITFTIPLVNGTSSVATVAYRKNDSSWASASATDGTALAGASLGQTGSFTWTLPTDEIPHYAFGISCFVYRIVFSVQLDSEVEVSGITGENTSGFQTIQNVWDGVMLEAIEALVYDSSASTYATYNSQAIKPGGLVGGASYDYIYFNAVDPLFGFYLDVGKTPNTTASSSIDQVATWTGTAWTAVTSLNDGTAGGANSGFVTWARNTSIKPLNFNSSRYYAFWYRIRFSQTLSADLTWAIQTLPYFDINKIFPVCQCVCVWDKRTWYSFNDNILYGTATGLPMSINGDDRVILTIGDFRSNKILAMRRFYNFMLVWQEEKGEEGGGFHIIQPGATAAGYASQVISDKIGIMNSKCVAVLEDVGMTDLNTERPIMKGVYFLSRSGVYKTDGSFLRNISSGIANYFDSSKSECIRAGYENKHYLTYDTLYRILRLGIVSGSSATEPNKFFVYNYATDKWAEDTLGQPLSSIFEVEASSGNVPILQYGGGQSGFVYRLNTTDNDVATAIDADVIMEMDSEKDRLVVQQELLKCKVQSAGDISRSVSVNGNTTYTNSRTISMTARVTGESYRREEVLTDHIEGEHLSFRWRNNTAAQSMYLLDVEFRLKPKYNR